MSPRTVQDQLNIFILDDHHETRRIVRTSLHNLKNASYSEYKDYYDLKSDLEFCWPDLLILDFDLQGGDVCSLVRALRHNELGMNPFVPVIAMTWESDRDSISGIINSGVDSVLLKPLTTNSIIKAVDKLVTHRKGFVVTSSYIGPDRRIDTSRPETEGLIEVPNTFKSKCNGETVNIVVLHAWIGRELMAINSVRLRSNAVEIARLLSLILPEYEAKTVTKKTLVHLRRITAIADDLSKRIEGGDFDHIANLCDNLVELANSIAARRLDPLEKDLRLIKPLSDAILSGISATGDELDAAREISSSLSGASA